MKISPRYDGPPLIWIDGAPDDQLAPVVRQRRRMETMLAALGADDWKAPSRCAGWTVQDVISHIIGVNAFWELSVREGLAGTPTRYLVGFDPAATPAQMVGAMQTLTAEEVFDQFVASNDGFLGVLSGLDADGWLTLAETPPGHLPIRLLASHAVWDTWVHERDIALPLGITPPVEADEVLASMRYAAALSPGFILSEGRDCRGSFAVEVIDLETSFTLDVGESVAVHDGALPTGAPRLRGDSVELVEALSIRAPLPDSAPAEWHELLVGLATAFETPTAVT
jgi:uncharacterized protein (TIGR03083 family)